jgi:S1-C subfamily serine protease
MNQNVPPRTLVAAPWLGLCAIAVVALIAAVPAEAAPASPTGAAQSSHVPDLGNSVVKVFSTMRYPDPYKPWTKQAPVDVTGSGVIIEGKRILTNAHVVLYASQVQVQANEAGDKMAATVVAVAPDIDLAVLKLEDESFFDARPPIARASKLPEIKDTVLAYGYPTGGSSLSITKGIVSRIEFVPYKFPVSGLRIQIDAAINPGNSGGPAIAGDRMIGLAFRKLTGDDNIGYIIPNEEIELFLKDIADGRYDGKPAMYDDLQTLENPAMRTFLKLDKNVEGVIVHEAYKSEEGYPLKQWDVITRIGDAPIDNQGMVKLGADLRVDFHYLVQKTAAAGYLPLSIVRDGKPMQIKLPVSAERPALVHDLNGSYPSYFVYGPLVFSRATWEFVAGIEKTGAARALSIMKSPLLTRSLDFPDADLQELVVVSSPFFPHKLAKGYSNVAGCVVASINGKHISSLLQLVALLRDLKDDFVTVEFAQKTGESLVFPRKEMVAATEDILTDNGVRAQGSPDTLAVWQGTPAAQ